MEERNLFKKGVCMKCKTSTIINNEGLCFSCTADKLIENVKRDFESKNTKGIESKEKKVEKTTSKDRKTKRKVKQCMECGREISIYAKGLCSKCYRLKYKKNKNGGEKMKEATKTATKNKEKEAEKKVTIDFSGYPELYDFVVKESVENFRTIELQVLWFIKQSLKEEKG